MYGRAIGIYATLNQAGITDYVMKGPSEAPPNASFAPPCVDVDGTLVGQTPAILLMLGEIYGLAGIGFDEKCRVSQALMDFDDIFF